MLNIQRKTIILFIALGFLVGLRPFSLQAYSNNSHDLSGKEFQFTHLTFDDGLPHNKILDILQDSQGFIWIATDGGGLARYDGYEMKVYALHLSDDSSLSSNLVWLLYEDWDKTLWVGTITGGLNRYNRETDDFTRFQHDPNDPTTLPTNDIKSMYRATDGTLWVGTHNGFSRFDQESNTFFTYFNDPDNPNSLSHNSVRDIYEEPETGRLWLATRRGGISVFDPKTEQFTNYFNDPDDPTSLSNDAVNMIYRDNAGNLWAGTRGGLNRFVPETETFIRYFHNPDDPTTVGHDWVSQIYEDRNGRFWMTTNGGIDLYHPETDTFTHSVHDPGDPTSIAQGSVWSLWEDFSGSIWFGTEFSGVSRLAGEPEKFTTWRHNPTNPNSLSNNKVWALHIDQKGHLWIGTEEGLNYFDGKTFTRYYHDPDNPNSLAGNRILAITEDLEGKLWISSEEGGLTHFDPETETFTRYTHNPDDPNSVASNYVVALLVDQKNTLWINNYDRGLDHFDGQTFIHYPYDENNTQFTGLPSPYLSHIVEDQDDNDIWIGTIDGLARLNPDTNLFTTYYLPGLVGSADNRINYIYQTQDGLLWLATTTGLYRFNPTDQTFSLHYTSEDGLPDDFVESILEDEVGNLWLTTTAGGLSRFDPKTETFRNYDAQDGLQSTQFYPRAVAKSPDGQMFVGGPKGFSAFYPDQVTDNPYIPPIVFTNFSLFNTPVEIGAEGSPLQKAINVTDALVLSHDQTAFTLEFAALNYTTPQKNQYAYMMEGFDKNWQHTTFDRRYATYTNLDPGSYTFRVKASNNDGIWNEEGISLFITITPPWWETTWAYALYILAATAIIIGFIGLRTQKIARHNKELEDELVEQKRRQEEKQQLLDAVQEQARRVRSVMDTVPQGIILLDADYRVIVKNPIAEEQLPFLAKWDQNGILTALGNQTLVAVLTSPPQGLWHEVYTEHSAGRQYYAVIARSIDSGIVLKNWVVVFRDITTERNIQERVAAQERLASIGQFAAGIAHDFNNILSVINLNAEILSRYGALQGKMQRKAESIVEQGEMARDLVQQILDYSRQSIMDRRVVDLYEVAVAQVNLISQILPRSIELDFESTETEYMIYGDPTRMGQILMNLLVNARDAMPNGGRIKIGLTSMNGSLDDKPFADMTDGKWVVLSVKDNGMGIPAQILPRIYEPFVTSKPVGKGTGLGLAQVFGIVKQHQGFIDVETAEGVGTTFSIYLPIYSMINGRQFSSLTQIEYEGLTHGNGETILLVEDNRELQEALKDTLENLGYRILVASDGEEGINIWTKNSDDIKLIISDVVMPRKSGVSMFKHLREQGAQQPCILMTGHMPEIEKTAMDELFAQGVVEVLKKPVNFIYLANLITSVLAEEG